MQSHLLRRDDVWLEKIYTSFNQIIQARKACPTGNKFRCKFTPSTITYPLDKSMSKIYNINTNAYLYMHNDDQGGGNNGRAGISSGTFR